MKRALFIILLLLAVRLNGQSPIQNDTIYIDEVKITGNKLPDHSFGSKIISADSSVISGFTHSNLGDLISDCFPVYIKTYGSGGLAVPSFRGTTAGHTGLAWNNIPIDNPMPGQSDMALIPAGFIDDVTVSYGGPTMSISNGSIGGLINIGTKPAWNEQFNVSVNPSAGSFHRKSLLLKTVFGSVDFQSVTKAFFSRAKNDFPYLNTVSGNEPKTNIRINNETGQTGFIQELYYRKASGTFSGRFWYQKAERTLPVPIISSPFEPPEQQSDESVRAMVEYEHQRNDAKLSATAAFIMDRLHYTNETVSIDSRNRSERFVFKSEYRNKIKNWINLRFAANNELSVVSTNNYDHRMTRNLFFADVETNLNIMKWLSATLLVKEIIQESRLLAPDFFAGVEIRPFSLTGYSIKASYAKNSKIPSLNDMYWSPGGNPGLDNETGYTSEIGLYANNVINSSLSIENNLTLFRNHISDMIQWHPGESSFWQADNINDMTSYGLEAHIGILYKHNLFSAGMNSGYSRTISYMTGTSESDVTVRKPQLIYVPADQFNLILRSEWKQLFASFHLNFTGKRYLTYDNSQYLPQYTVSDADIGIRIITNRIISDIKFIVDNIFDTDYQNIAYYPMPGRSYMLSVTFKYKN